MPVHIGAVDHGISASRLIVFDQAGAIVSLAQKEHRQVCPKPGRGE